MKFFSKPSKASGSVTAPPSKSMMIRMVAAAALSKGQTTIRNPTFCNDAQAALRIADALGANVMSGGDCVIIEGGRSPRERLLDCGESGLCMRMFCAIASLCSDEIQLIGGPSLTRRPLPDIQTPLSKLGVDVRTDNGHPPVKVKGPMNGGNIVLDGAQSSQFITGMLFALPLCNTNSALEIKDLQSAPYIRMTLSVLRDFGVSIESNIVLNRFKILARQSYIAGEFSIEGDWSGAAFFMVAGAVAGNVTLAGIDKRSLQADKKICQALKQAGAKVLLQKDRINVQKDRLRAFSFDANDCPDLFPPLVTLAANCDGISTIHGTERLVFKESNRALELYEKFEKLGIKIDIAENRMIIHGGRIQGGDVDSGNDHRIAMALAIAGLTSKEGVSISRAQCVDKSYPNFYDDLRKITG